MHVCRRRLPPAGSGYALITIMYTSSCAARHSRRLEIRTNRVRVHRGRTVHRWQCELLNVDEKVPFESDRFRGFSFGWCCNWIYVNIIVYELHLGRILFLCVIRSYLDRSRLCVVVRIIKIFFNIVRSNQRIPNMLRRSEACLPLALIVGVHVPSVFFVQMYNRLISIRWISLDSYPSALSVFDIRRHVWVMIYRSMNNEFTTVQPFPSAF